MAFFVRESHYFEEEYIDTDDVIAFSPSLLNSKGGGGGGWGGFGETN